MDHAWEVARMVLELACNVVYLGFDVSCSCHLFIGLKTNIIPPIERPKPSIKSYSPLREIGACTIEPTMGFPIFVRLTSPGIAGDRHNNANNRDAEQCNKLKEH